MSHINTQTNTGSSGTGSVTKPSSVAAGDIALIAGSIDAGGGSFTWPTGFTEVLTGVVITRDGQVLKAALKKLDGTEGASFSITLPTNTNWAFLASAYSGRDQTTWIDVTSTVTGNNGNNTSPVSITASTITTVTDGCDLLWIATLDNATSGAVVNGISFTPPTLWNERADVSGGSFSNISLADVTQSTQGATGSVTGTGVLTSGQAGWGAFLIALRPAAGAGVSGTIANTLADFVSAIAGVLTQQGTIAQTLAAYTSAIAGTEVQQGTMAVTLANHTPAFSGDVVQVGTLSSVLSAFVSAIAGTPIIVGDMAVTLANFIGAFFENEAGQGSSWSAKKLFRDIFYKMFHHNMSGNRHRA